MKFKICRASDWSSDKAPIDGAVKEGSDWTIEIGTLEELLALQVRAGADLIVNSYSIWIYDDYME